MPPPFIPTVKREPPSDCPTFEDLVQWEEIQCQALKTRPGGRVSCERPIYSRLNKRAIVEAAYRGVAEFKNDFI